MFFTILIRFEFLFLQTRIISCPFKAIRRVCDYFAQLNEQHMNLDLCKNCDLRFKTLFNCLAYTIIYKILEIETKACLFFVVAALACVCALLFPFIKFVCIPPPLSQKCEEMSKEEGAKDKEQ